MKNYLEKFFFSKAFCDKSMVKIVNKRQVEKNPKSCQAFPITKSLIYKKKKEQNLDK